MERIVPVKFLAIYISAAIKWRGKSEKEGDWNCIGCRGMTSKWRKREGRWLICSFRLKNKWRIRVEGIEWDFWRHFITSVPFSSSIQLKDYDEQLFAFYLIVSGKTTGIQYGNWKEKWVEVEDSLFKRGSRRRRSRGMTNFYFQFGATGRSSRSAIQWTFLINWCIN